ncbi:MAG: site-specific integrase [Planctomycetes bacterium]|nr:site-specific integrase [Planctomycetota bacterium]
MPKLGVHKATGQARVTLNGTTFYLGKAGTIEAHAKYAELVKTWLAQGQQAIRPAATVVQLATSVREVFDQFLAHADATGRYSKGGKPGTHYRRFEWIRDSLGAALGNPPVAKLTESSLVLWRDLLERDKGRTRPGINRLVACALLVLKWGRARGLVPKVVWADVSTIEPLKRGEVGDRPDHGKPRRAVTNEEANKVAAHASRQVGAMIRLQSMLGMRPSEVCAMRWADIDKAPIPGDRTKCWTYTVPAGKTSHHGHVTRFLLPLAAQKILNEFPAAANAYIFSPASAMAERRELLREARKSDPTKQTELRDSTARRDYADRWGVNEYRHAVARACRAAGVPCFTPHELRHGFATWAANTLSLGAASAACNHRSVATTQRYVHVRHEDVLAVAVAAQKRATG